jgi:hypothetical protein
MLALAFWVSAQRQVTPPGWRRSGLGFATLVGSKEETSTSSSVGPKGAMTGPALAQELVRLNVDVLVSHGAAGALAAKKATSTIPIVITAVSRAMAERLLLPVMA